MNEKRVLPTILLIFLTLLAVTGCKQGPTEVQRAPGPEVGRPAPDFTWEDAYGTAHSLSDYRGKAVILVFWSPTCKHCRNELKYLRQFLADSAYKDESIVIGVSQDLGDIELPDGFNAVLETGMEISSRYWVKGVPTLFFIDPDGVIQVKKIGGDLYFWEIEEYVASMFAGP